MSIVIFFAMALAIFISGLAMIFIVFRYQSPFDSEGEGEIQSPSPNRP